MVGPSGGAQAPAKAVREPRTNTGAPGRQTATVSSPSAVRWASSRGTSARRGPYRSMRAALAGARRTTVAPKSAITVPATAYEPEARVTASITDSGTTP